MKVLTKDINRITNENNNSEEKAKLIEESAKKQELQIHELEENIKLEEREKENLNHQLNDNNESLENKRLAREDLKQKLDEYQLRIKNISKQLYGVEGKLYLKLSRELERLESNKESNNLKLYEDYNLTYLQAVELKDDEIDINRKILDSLKKDIKSLGNVNIDSIEEYKETKERYDFYSEQREDLEKSIEAIEEIIKDLEEHMKIQFKEEFYEINENFKYVYKRLFGGGEGSLRILDEENILESDIEITAKPPGKK